MIIVVKCHLEQHLQTWVGGAITDHSLPYAHGAQPVAQKGAGTIVGTSKELVAEHGHRWTGAGTDKGADRLDEGTWFTCRPCAISNAGAVVVTHEDPGSVHAAIVSETGAARSTTVIGRIGLPGFAAHTGATSDARWINESGVVVGHGQRPDSEVTQPGAWQNGELSWLPVPDGWTSARAWEVNEAGLIVGEVRRQNGIHVDTRMAVSSSGDSQG